MLADRRRRKRRTWSRNVLDGPHLIGEASEGNRNRIECSALTFDECKAGSKVGSEMKRN